MKSLVVCAALAVGFNLRDVRQDPAAATTVDPAATVAAGATTAAPTTTLPLGPVSVANYQAFATRMANLLSCAALEQEVTRKCGILQVWELIPQFGGSFTNCNSAYLSNPSVKSLFENYMGPGANCYTSVSAFSTWVNADGQQLYSSQRDCMQAIRTDAFNIFCTIAELTTTIAPPATAAPAAAAAPAEEARLADVSDSGVIF